MFRNRRVRILSVFALPILGAFAWTFLETYRTSGVYLIRGGLDYFVISSNGFKNQMYDPGIADSIMNANSQMNAAPKLSIRHHGGILHLDYALRNTGATNPPSWFFDLRRSRKARGDWDLIQYSTIDFLNPWARRQSEEEPPLLNDPVESYLHRTNDNRILKYFTAQYRDGDRVKAFALAEELLKDHPDDLQIRALFLNGALKKTDLETLAREFQLWRAAFSNSSNPWLRRIPALADQALHADALTKQGRNGAAIYWDLFDPAPVDLETLLKRMPLVLQAGEFETMPRDFDVAISSTPNLLPQQITVKVLQEMGMFRLIQGRRDEARDLLLSSYVAGHGLGEAAGPMERMIGVAYRSISLGGLEIYLLNACETLEETKSFSEFLDRWKDRPSPYEREKMPSSGDPLFDLLDTNDSRKSYFQETRTRFNCSEARYRILRAATSAHYCRLTTGTFPASEAEFPLLGKLPIDPFGKEHPLRFVPGSEEFTVYSVGPDRIDDAAAFAHDPTNGTNSRGDVLLKIPVQREFPFPREPLRAGKPEDVAAQFPNGLPRDLFARTRDLPLNVTSNEDGAVVVYSFGPDADEPNITTETSHTLEIMYDPPTNGTTSNGDLFIELPPK